MKIRQMNFLALLHYVFSMIKSRPLAFMLNVLIVCIAAVYIDSLGYFSDSIYSQVKPTDDQNRLIINCNQSRLNDPEHLFTSEKTKEYCRQPFIDLAVEIIERGVNMSIGQGQSNFYNVQSTVPKDQDINPKNLLAGRHVSSDAAKEIIMSLAVYNDLSSEKFNGQIKDEKVRVHLERIRNGRTESLDEDYLLAGLIDSFDQLVYMPVNSLRAIDKWNLSAINDLSESESSNREKTDYPSLLAFFRSRPEAQTIKELADNYQVKFEPAIDSQYLACSTEPAFRISSQAAVKIETARKNYGKYPEIDKYFLLSQEKFVFRGKEYKLVAVEPKDKRLADLKCTNKAVVSEILAKTGQAVFSPELAESLSGQDRLVYREEVFPRTLVLGGVLEKPADNFEFDVICSLETLVYLNQSCRSDLVYLVYTKDRVISEKLRKGGLGKLIAAGPKPDQPDKDLIPSSRMSLKKSVVIAPKKVDEPPKTSVSDPSQGLEPIGKENPRLTAPRQVAENSERQISKSAIDPKTSVERPVEPPPIAESNQPAADGIAVTEEELEDFFTSISGFFGVKGASREFEDLVVIAADLKDQTFVETVKKNLIRVEPVYLVPESASGKGLSNKPTLLVCEPEALARLDFMAEKYLSKNQCLVSEGFPASQLKTFFNQPNLECVFSKTRLFPENTALFKLGDIDSYGLEIDEKNFGHTAEAFAAQSVNCADLYLKDINQYYPSKEQYQSAGWTVTDLCYILKMPVYAARFIPLNGQFLPAETESLLKDDAAFEAVVPELTVQGTVKYGSQSLDLSLNSSIPGDLRSKLAKLPAGSWLLSDERSEVILPKSLLEKAGISLSDFEPGLKPVVFRKHDAKGLLLQEVSVDCLVSGIVEGEVGYISLGLAKKIEGWKRGLIQYSDRLGFADGSKIYDSSGYARCKVFVPSSDDLGSAMKYFTDLGYMPDDPLAEKKRAVFLRNILIFLVIVMVGGSLFGGIANVFTTTLMNAQSKQYENGLLRAAGVSNWTIIKIYLVYGLIIGLSAGILSLPLSGLITYFVVNFLEQAFRLPIKDMLQFQIWHYSFFWLHALTIVIAVVSAVGAVIVAAVLALRVPIADAFSMRE